MRIHHRSTLALMSKDGHMPDLKAETFPRRYVPRDTDMGDWSQIEPCFDELEGRPIGDLAQFEQWILDQGELAACIAEEASKRYVAMTCHTDDAQAEAAYLFYVEQIAPREKPRWHRLRERYMSMTWRTALPRPRYFVYDRGVTCAAELFRPENVPLQTEDEKLAQQFQKICGAMTVQYEGQEQTLQQMSRYLKLPDARVREEAWRLVSQRRLQHRDDFDGLFDQMIELRTQIARNAGLDNFRDHQFKHFERFDYSPADCEAFHATIAELVVPLKRAWQEKRRKSLGVDVLRPWDLSVDPKNCPPLRPFATTAELCDKTLTIFRRLDPELAEQFSTMVEAGWLDLESRKGKAPGGYQTVFSETRRPFIFMNAVGLHSDVQTLVHECGHAFHTIACRNDPLYAYRESRLEMAEVASMGMEMLAQDHLEVFYQDSDLRRARREHLEDVVGLFPWIATIDAFQHWLYLHPGHTHAQRTEAWLQLLERFGGIEDWTGCEEAQQALWQRQLHLFEVPFYYIEYGIAQIGALQLWVNARRDRSQALRQYREALALGGREPVPALWAAAGLKFDFTAATLGPLIEAVQQELDHLGDD